MSGLVNRTVPSGATLFGAPQVLPPLVDTSVVQKYCCGVGWTPEPRNSIAPMSTSVPSGSTAIWLPCTKTIDLIIGLGVVHVRPPSEVIENIG